MGPPSTLIPHLLRILADPPYHPSSIHIIGLLLFPILKYKVQYDGDIWPAFLKVHGQGAGIRIYGRVPGYDMDLSALEMASDNTVRDDTREAVGSDRSLWGLAIFTPGHYDRPYVRFHAWLSAESNQIVGDHASPSTSVSSSATSLFTHILASFIIPSTLKVDRKVFLFSSLNRCWIPVVREYVGSELKDCGAEIGRVGTATKVAKRIRADRNSPTSSSFPSLSLSTSSSPSARLPVGYTIREARTTDVSLILSHNALKFDREYMDGLVWLGCIVEDSDGERVGWSLSHEDLSFCALHTIPSARKHGIGKTLIESISTIQAEAIRASAYNPYATSPVVSPGRVDGETATATDAEVVIHEEGVWVHGDAEEYNQVVLGWFERQGFERVVDNVWLSVSLRE